MGLGLLTGGILAIGVLAAGCGSRFPDSNMVGPYERTVLLEEGTATWCTYCPEAAENIEALLDAHPGEFVVLALHSNDQYSSSETQARLDRLGVSGYPTIIFDGVERSGRKVSQMEPVLAARLALKSFVKLDLTALATPDSVRYQIAAVVSGELSESITGTLRIALVQDTSTFPSQGVLHHIVRRLPEAGTEDEMTLNPGDTLTFTRSLARDTTWLGELTAVVWIEGGGLDGGLDEGLECYQAASTKVTTQEVGDFSIALESDTVLTVQNQGDDAFFYFSLKNNTSAQLSLHVDTPVELRDLPTGWLTLICDDSQCYGDSVNVTVPANGSTQRLHVQMISGTEGSEGKVMLTVDAGTAEVDSRTFILKIAQ